MSTPIEDYALLADLMTGPLVSLSLGRRAAAAVEGAAAVER